MRVSARNAFTLVEVLVVVVILGILAAVVVPRFAGATDDARTSSLQSTLAGVRSSIASYRMDAVINGDDPYPSLAQLTDGSVVKFELPENPFTGVSGVQAVSSAQASARAVVGAEGAGWNYFVDNDADPPTAIFYANTDSATTEPDGSGGFESANDL
jgi:general secretion pathway protein G